MSISHIAAIAAYPIKDELGGGFRGVFFDRLTKERVASDRFDALEYAKHWAQSQAWDRCGNLPDFNVAPLRRRGECQASVWVQI